MYTMYTWTFWFTIKWRGGAPHMEPGTIIARSPMIISSSLSYTLQHFQTHNHREKGKPSFWNLFQKLTSSKWSILNKIYWGEKGVLSHNLKAETQNFCSLNLALEQHMSEDVGNLCELLRDIVGGLAYRKPVMFRRAASSSHLHQQETPPHNMHNMHIIYAPPPPPLPYNMQI